MIMDEEANFQKLLIQEGLNLPTDSPMYWCDIVKEIKDNPVRTLRVIRFLLNEY